MSCAPVKPRIYGATATVDGCRYWCLKTSDAHHMGLLSWRAAMERLGNWYAGLPVDARTYQPVTTWNGAA